MDALETYAQDDDGFSRWLVTRLDLCPQARADLDVAKDALHSSSIAVVCGGRDAVARLHGLAVMANFVDSAAFYYHIYELFCHRLLLLIEL